MDNDKLLMILVITGRSESMQLTTNRAGIGSSLQDFFADLSINLHTSFSDSCEKWSIMLHGCKQLLLHDGKEDNPEIMLSSLA